MIVHTSNDLEKFVLTKDFNKTEFNTLFLSLVSKNDPSILKALLSSKILSTKISSSILQNAFTEACSQGNLETVVFLLKQKKLNINPNYNNDSAFVWACSMNRENIIQYLLEKNYVDISTNNHYVFRVAAMHSSSHTLHYLLTSPKLTSHSDPFAKDNNAFINACAYHNLDTINYFINNTSLHSVFNTKTVNSALQETVLKCSKKSKEEEVNNAITIVNNICKMSSNIFYEAYKLLNYSFYSEQPELIEHVLHIPEIKNYFTHENGAQSILKETIKEGNLTKFSYLVRDSVINLLPQKDEFLLCVIKEVIDAAIYNHDFQFIEYIAEHYQFPLTKDMKKYLAHPDYQEFSKYFLYGSLNTEVEHSSKKQSAKTKL